MLHFWDYIIDGQNLKFTYDVYPWIFRCHLNCWHNRKVNEYCWQPLFFKQWIASEFFLIKQNFLKHFFASFSAEKLSQNIRNTHNNPCMFVSYYNLFTSVICRGKVSWVKKLQCIIFILRRTMKNVTWCSNRITQCERKKKKKFLWRGKSADVDIEAIARISSIIIQQIHGMSNIKL